MDNKEYRIPKKRPFDSVAAKKNTPDFKDKNDRFCIFCNWVIQKQNLLKAAKCTNVKCSKELPFRGQEITEDGWMRCMECDGFMACSLIGCQMACSHLGCQMCGWKNHYGFELRRRRQEEAAKRSLECKDAQLKATNLKLEQALAKIAAFEEKEELELFKTAEELENSQGTMDGTDNPDGDRTVETKNTDEAEVNIETDEAEVNVETNRAAKE